MNVPNTTDIIWVDYGTYNTDCSLEYNDVSVDSKEKSKYISQYYDGWIVGILIGTYYKGNK